MKHICVHDLGLMDLINIHMNSYKQLKMKGLDVISINVRSQIRILTQYKQGGVNINHFVLT